MLYILATPIGNLKDITLRALETLKLVDGVICEDTRRTGILLNHYSIQKPLIVLNDFNENKTFPQIIEKLQNGQNLTLVSDAGTPLVSDPGYKLVRECLRLGIKVDSIPGPSAAIAALTLSGLPPDKFLFLGFPPEKKSNRIKWIVKMEKISKILNTTIILYVSPYKLKSLLLELQECLGEIEIVLAKELTKLNQSVKRQVISKWLDHFSKGSPKGEYTLLFNLTQKNQD